MAAKLEVPLADMLRSPDTLITIGIVMIVMMMIVPMPTFFLDLLLALNITLALMILLVSMYTKNALEFSIFPSILLISTLFRLALNISSTRLILLYADNFNSQIIKSFGNFVVGGNYIVGIVIFSIITLINFMVITKGSGRVAEVAARFTLDAMPGKQMAIDADFNSGAIDEPEAKVRRVDLQREADFYGAMDGASKFVQGDAIAGIIITVINVIGGLVIGMYQHELGAVEALELFTLLTVGDGLVSQVPALLISTATGLVVTRAADDSNLGENIAKQIAGQSRPLAIASGVLFFLGAIPGLPTFSFWVLGSGAGWLAWIVSKQKEVEKTEKDVAQQKKETSSARTTENMAAGLLVTDPMELEIGYSLIPLVDVNQGGNLLERIQMLRKQSGLQLGLIVPSIRIRDNMQLNPDVYVIRIKGMEVARGQLMINHFLAVNPGTVTREIQGHETMEPAFGLPALWVTELQREEAELAGYTVADVASVVATHLTEIIKRHAHEILGRQEVQTMIDTLKENASCKDLIAELFPTVLKAGEFRKLLQNLLKEGVSIRNQITILEALDEAAADAAGDIDYLTERVREGLKRQITQSLLSPDGTLNVISLDPGLENHLAGAVEKGERGVYLAVEPDVAQKLWKVVAAESKKMTIHGLTPVILVSGAIRLYFRRFIEKTVSNVNVISYNEVSEDVNVNAVGIIRL